MTQKDKTKEGPIKKISPLQKHMAELEAVDTERKQALQIAKEARAYAENIVETIREPLIVLDTDLKIISANRSFYQTFKVNHEETKGRFIYDLGNRQWDIPKLRHLLEEILPKNNTFNNYEIEHDFEAIGPKVMLLNARRLETAQMILLAIEDITERKRLEEELMQHRENLEKTVKERTAKLKQTDKELRAASLYTRNLIEASLDPLMTISSDGKITDVNKTTEQVTGVSRERLIGSDFANYFTEPEKARAGYKQVFLQGVVKDYPLTIRHASGRTTDVLYNASVYKNEVGEVQGVFAAARDITERKQVEEAMKASEIRYRRLFETAQDGILILNAETGMIVDVNPFLIEMLGFSHEQFVGKAIWEIGLFKDIASNKDKFIELQRQGYIRYEDLPLETAHGQRIAVEFVSNIYTVDHQKVIQCNIRDITERKRVEKLLSDSEVRYRRLFEAAQDGILILDAETGTIVDVNPFLVEMLGFPHEQFVGKAIWEIGLFKDIASNKDKFIELQRQGYVRYEDLPLETAHGQRIAVEFVSNIYTVDHQKVIQCNIRDITKRKQLEEELKSNVEMKSKFTSMASHELRSPLGVIKEGINLVLEGLAGDINDEQRDLLDTAKKNTDRLGRLINNVLDFQKMDSGKMWFDIRENDINEAVLEVNKAMSLAAKEKGLDLAVDVDDSIPKTGFDKDKIIEVLTNLVSNAIKYTEKGNITISTKQKDNTVHVIVQDTGMGIKAEDMQKLFQAFEQLGSTRDKKGIGTGLGLAISKEIILAHKGKIWAESKPGKGSTFHFTIPKKPKEKKKIGEILVEEGKISEEDVKKALEKQEKQE